MIKHLQDFKTGYLWASYSLIVAITVLVAQYPLLHAGFWTDDFHFIKELSGMSIGKAMQLWVPAHFGAIALSSLYIGGLVFNCGGKVHFCST